MAKKKSSRCLGRARARNPTNLLKDTPRSWGDIYYNKRVPDGSLKPWGPANKVAAYILLLFNIMLFIS